MIAPETILADYDLRTALAALSTKGFRIFVLEKGTICAYKNKACYGFAPRHGRFSREMIWRAIEDNRDAQVQR